MQFVKGERTFADAIEDDEGPMRAWAVEAEALLRVADGRLRRDFTEEERTHYADLLPARTGD